MQTPFPAIIMAERLVLRCNKKKTVVNGQATSLKAIAYKIKQGIPVQATSRQIESTFRNMDLTDAQNASTQYKSLVNKMQQQQLQHEASQQQQRLEQQQLIQSFKDWQATQSGSKTPPNEPPSPAKPSH